MVVFSRRFSMVAFEIRETVLQLAVCKLEPSGTDGVILSLRGTVEYNQGPRGGKISKDCRNSEEEKIGAGWNRTQKLRKKYDGWRGEGGSWRRQIIYIMSLSLVNT